MLISLLCLLAVSVILAACAKETEKSEEKQTPATVAVDQMEFDLTYPSDIVFQITLNDAKFSKLTLEGADVAAENYAREGTTFTIKATYLSAKAEGDYSFSYVTTINTLTLKVKVVRNPKNPPTNEELMSDPYYSVDQNGQNVIMEPTDEAWEKLKEMREPLGYGESFTETFGNSFYESRLLPYRDELFSTDHSLWGANFTMTEDDSKQAVHIFGHKEGEYYLEQSWEHVAFRGVRFTEGAEYKVEIKYTPRTENARFQLCFNTPQNAICNLLGTKDQPSVTAGRFVADTANGYNGTIAAYLLVSFGGGSSAEEIDINQITVTRLKQAPAITNGRFEAQTEGGFISAGELSLSYDLDIDTGMGEAIRWVASTERDLSRNVIELKSADTSDPDAKKLAVTEDLKGMYIAAYVTPNVDQNEYQLVNSPVFVTENKVLGEVSYTDADLTAEAAAFTEDFERFAEQNITFWDMGGKTYVGKAPAGMSGNVLYVECDGSAQYQGVRFGGYTLKKEAVYQVSFKVMFRGNVPDNWTVKFRPGDAYWDDVQVETPLADKQTDTVYEITLAPMVLGSNDSPYQLLMHNYARNCTVIIDDLTIEKVEPVTLVNVGDKATLDFDSAFEMFAADSNPDLKTTGTVVSSGAAGMSGSYLKLEGGADVVGTTLNGFTMTPGKSYRLTMKLFVVSEAELGGQFLVKFMAEDGSYVQDMQYTSSIANNALVTYKTGVITLDADKTYDRIDVLNYYMGYTMYVDEISLEVVEKPDTALPQTSLTQVGDIVSDNFEGSERSLLCTSMNPEVSKVQDRSGIGTSFGTALQVVFKGSGGAYNLATFTNYTLQAGGTYRVSFDYKVIEADTVNTYASAVMRWDDGKDYPNIQNGLWVGSVSETVQQYSFDFTLTGESDEWKFSLSNWGADVHATILLDNLKIEKIA